MKLSFHHFFVFCPPGGAEAGALLSSGFAEGSRNTHPGQGTANRRFFFSNGMLEFVWVCDPSEIQSPVTRPTNLYERSRYVQTGFSPFGIGAYGQPDGPSDTPPFPGWPYHPAYLPPELAIWVADNSSSPEEPMLFYGSFFPPPSRNSGKEPTSHSNGVERITSIRIQTVGKNRRRSMALEQFAKIGLLDFREGKEPLASIGFGGGRQNQELDLRPSLPVVLKF